MASMARAPSMMREDEKAPEAMDEGVKEDLGVVGEVSVVEDVVDAI